MLFYDAGYHSPTWPPGKEVTVRKAKDPGMTGKLKRKILERVKRGESLMFLRPEAELRRFLDEVGEAFSTQERTGRVTGVDLSGYEKILRGYESVYEHDDEAHGMEHVRRVRNLAVALARRHAPELVELAYIAATLHDIERHRLPKGHEERGAEIVRKDKRLRKLLGPVAHDDVVHAIREHRASTGNPRSTLAKIVSDSDKASDGTEFAMYRSTSYQVLRAVKKNDPPKSKEEYAWDAVVHLSTKFGKEGTGKRLYFKESLKHQNETYLPILRVRIKRDMRAAWELLGPEFQRKIEDQIRKMPQS